MPALYHRIDGEYRCSLCQQRFHSHQSLNYHLIQSKTPCIDRLFVQRQRDTNEEVTEFAGERLIAPSAPVSFGEHAENRDEWGRLRVAGMLTGYRGWSIGRIGGQFRIFPVFQQSFIPYEKGVLTAYCTSSHAAPSKDCSCGFYAAWVPNQSKTFTGTANRTFLHGRLKAFGKVLPGELGWRAQYVMVDGFYKPTCGVSGCENEAKRYIVRPDWIRPIAPSGRTFPTAASTRYDTYRDHADFASSNISTAYLGWYCDQHEFTELVSPQYEYRCNYPTKFETHCERKSTLALRGRPYSWCNEHAPVIFDADEVINALCNYYDVYLLDKENA